MPSGGPSQGSGSPNPFAEYARRWNQAWTLGLNPPPTPAGATPYQEVYRDGRARLLYYPPPSGSSRKYRPPVLFVYALINKSYIMDLQPGLSVVESLQKRGLDVYLIDWGVPTRSDKDLTIDDYVNGYIGRAVDAVRKRTGEEKIHILGYCMGGTFSAMYACLHPAKVQALALMAAPLDFESTEGLLHLWSHAPGFSGKKISETFGLIPAWFFNQAFALLDPMRTSYLKFRDLLDHMDDPAYVDNFLRMERWTNDGIPMAGPTYAEFIENGYQKNLLVKGGWKLGGHELDLSDLTMPVATIVGLKDNLVPAECTYKVLDHVGTRDVTRFDQPSGHIGLSVSRQAHQDLWPKVADWYLARSPKKAPKPRGRRRTRP
jgi:polyhydroxyalkanoate synthase